MKPEVRVLRLLIAAIETLALSTSFLAAAGTTQNHEHANNHADDAAAFMRQAAQLLLAMEQEAK